MVLIVLMFAPNIKSHAALENLNGVVLCKPGRIKYAVNLGNLELEKLVICCAHCDYGQVTYVMC